MLNPILMYRYSRLIILFVIFAIAACSPEYRLARQYVRNQVGNTVMILPSYELYKDNLTISYDTNVIYSPVQFDSIAWEQSCYIKHVSDSIFLTTFTRSLIKELKKEEFEVYVSDNSNAFQELPEPKWLVKIPLLQLNENHCISIYGVSSENQENYGYSLAGLRTNMISLLSWFEASQASKGNPQGLFYHESIMDGLTSGSKLILDMGNEGLQQNRDSLEIEDIYTLADESGRKHAGILFNHFMNEYVRNNLPPGIIPKKYFYYNRISQSLRPGLNEWYELAD